MKFVTALGSVHVAPAAAQNIEGKTSLEAADTVALAKVSFRERPSSLQLKLRFENSNPKNYIYLLRSGKPAEEIGSGDVRLLLVGVKWDGDIPQTRDRESNTDCLDFFVMQPNGRFVDVEVGLVTRGGKFFISAQRVYEGQAVRTREAGKLVTQLLPGRAIHAYPDSNFQNVWTTLADTVLEKVTTMKASEQKSRAYVPRWNPPTLPQLNGDWMPGVVRYFNSMTGTGELEDGAGKRYFVHYRDILPYRDGQPLPEVPLLTPMSVVQFRFESNTRHLRPKIRSVRPLLPVLAVEPRK